MPDGILSFWSVPILQPLAKQSIELSGYVSIIPCNVLDILPAYFYECKFRNKCFNCFYGNYASFFAKLSRDRSLDGFLQFDVVALQHPSELLMMLSVALTASTVFEGVPVQHPSEW
jgi:hypothetical protein